MIVPRYLVFGCNANIFCNSLGLLYPVIVTYKEMKLLPLKGEKKNMLNYWVIYSCICVGDFFSKFIASWYWLVKVSHLMRTSYIYSCNIKTQCFNIYCSVRFPHTGLLLQLPEV